MVAGKQRWGSGGVSDHLNALDGPSKPAATFRLRRYASLVLLVLIVAAMSWTIVKNRNSFTETLQKVGPVGIVLSLLFGILGIGATGMQWRAVLAGLGVGFGVRGGARVFFTSQLGKYLPGSVWPIVIQMEAGRTRGANRKTIVAANLITLVLSFATGLVLAGALLPFSVPSALHRFWWALAALPLVLVLALPKTLPYLMDRLLLVLRRQPLGVRFDVRATIRASAWAIVSWVGLGVHLAILAAAVGHVSAGLIALCIGGVGLAVPAGVLFLPAPAGAGMRELVLGYVLVAVLTSGQALAVVVASRMILILVDLILAAASVALAPRRPAVTTGLQQS
ncbi:MAG: glycosyltransferase 2 family protein [Pseudonocardiales bacterium]|nr:glycosyltransferase 2 family protein [Pseudonocardiales bacterium]